jgi:hypothetical protein
MASQLVSPNTPRRSGGDRRDGPTFGRQTATVFRRILAALARAHRRKIEFELARYWEGDGQMGTDLEHQMSWRFGVPVR